MRRIAGMRSGKGYSALAGLVFTWLATGSGCSSQGSGGELGAGGSSGSSSSGVVPLGSFAAEYADVLCDGLSRCCPAAGLPYDDATCRSNWLLVSQSIVTVAEPPNVSYNGNAAATCFEAIRADLAACNNFSDVGDNEPACRQVFQGTLPNGAECQESIECARPAEGSVGCSQDDLGVRRCDQRPLGVLGSPCEGTCSREGNVTFCSLGGSGAARCYKNDGLFCDDTGTGTCQRLVAIGGDCTGFKECVDGAFCDGTVCAARLPVGSACGGDSECAATAYCETGFCVVRKPVGATCTFDVECAGGGCNNGVCEDALAFPTASQCRGELL